MTDDTWKMCLINFVIAVLQISLVHQSQAEKKSYVPLISKSSWHEQYYRWYLQLDSLRCALQVNAHLSIFCVLPVYEEPSHLDWHVKGLSSGATSSKHSPLPCIHLYVKFLEGLSMRRGAWSCSISPALHSPTEETEEGKWTAHGLVLFADSTPLTQL